MVAMRVRSCAETLVATALANALAPSKVLANSFAVVVK